MMNVRQALKYIITIEPEDVLKNEKAMDLMHALKAESRASQA